MAVDQKLHFAIFLSSLLLSSLSSLKAREGNYNSTANSPAFWIYPSDHTVDSMDIYIVTPVLIRESLTANYMCGFYCKRESNECLFGVLIYQGWWLENLQTLKLVWSANRNNPVQKNSVLQLRQDGDLVLANSDGVLIWSSNTKGQPVSGLNLTEMGNLVLFGRNNESIWQSFDHPTDSLLLGQKLALGQTLRASESETNWTQGRFSFSYASDGLSAYIESDPPQRYFLAKFGSRRYLEFRNGSFKGFTNPFASVAVAQFVRFEPDGHLKLYQGGEPGFGEVIDILDPYVGDCGYPMVCGNYGVCSKGQCGCVETTNDHGISYFSQINFRQPDLGCSLVTPISCDHSRDHTLLELKNTSYFALDSRLDRGNMVMEDCKSKCLSNCLCKAAVYYYADRWEALGGNGSCLLLNEVFSIANNENNARPPYDTTLFLKVQNVHRSNTKTVVLGTAFGALFCVISLICCCLFLRRRILGESDEIEGDFLNQVPGMPKRYSYEKLKAMTEDFSKKLGEGGFGSVYEGALSNGTKIAVKCLDGLGRVKDSFLSEVQIIGSIHHVNLVKLIGFCVHKSHRLLVYEYMPNGSLDKWISGRNNQSLRWNARRRIITEIARGLAYLHEDCSQKIIHFDIKPQNILLDRNFNAKVADFGLCKLVEKDQSRVITRMRGTPGYMAPEWLSSVITEKVDVYSFGIVMLEILCGRKNVDWSEVEENRHLLSVFKRRAEEGKLEDMVDKSNMDMVIHAQEAVEMMGIAAWCLQSNFTKRPSMSLVVKVLDGLVAPETNLDYDFTNPSVAETGAAGHQGREAVVDIASQLLPSALSGPR